MDSEREWLAACLRGDDPTPWPAPGVAARAAHAEGVVALVHSVLSARADVPAPLLTALAAGARGAAVRQLAQATEASRVAQVLAGAGLDAIALKGTAYAAWLYTADEVRESEDIDVWVRDRAAADRAAAALVAAGCTMPLPTLPGDLVSFEWLCVAPDRGFGAVPIDVHWQACNTVLWGDLLDFDSTWAAGQALPALGPRLRALGTVHALLHSSVQLALKRQVGQADPLRWLVDIARLAVRLAPPEWDALAVLAIARGAAGATLRGLQAARCVGAMVPPAIESRLREAAAREPIDVARLGQWAYALRAGWRALPDARHRLRWLRQRLLPAPGYLRELYGRPGDGWLRILWRRAQAAGAQVLGTPRG